MLEFGILHATIVYTKIVALYLFAKHGHIRTLVIFSRIINVQKIVNFQDFIKIRKVECKLTLIYSIKSLPAVRIASTRPLNVTVHLEYAAAFTCGPQHGVYFFNSDEQQYVKLKLIVSAFKCMVKLPDLSKSF